MVVEGVATLLPLHRLIMRSDEFARGETCAGLVEDTWPAMLRRAVVAPVAAPGRSVAATEPHAVIAEVNGRRFAVTIHTPADPVAQETRARREQRRQQAHGAGGPGALLSPMQGTVLRVAARDAEPVRQGQVVAIVEAMKMENELLAPRDGIVRGLTIRAGDAVTTGQLICRIEPAPA
jgi:acetyl-CoA/propionyl-CoA carboxylase, biotin carboxylase, biotin carboxyl carrier protein